tara:strand:+ start:1009 stop:1119 length:111 start_codon:yes stop_codon:yes gene_type:complete
LIGERNGMIVGMMLNTAQIGAEEGNQRNETNIYYFS